MESVSKFLLYGFIDPTRSDSAFAVNRIAAAVADARFRATSPAEDAVALTGVLQLGETVARSPAGCLLTGVAFGRLLETCIRIGRQKASGSVLLRRAAETAASHLLLTAFRRAPALAARQSQRRSPKPAASAQRRTGPAPGAGPSSPFGASVRSSPASGTDARIMPSSPTPLPGASPALASPPRLRNSGSGLLGAGCESETDNAPYGEACLAAALTTLAGLADPAAAHASADGAWLRPAALRLLLVALEAGGEALAHLPEVIAALQAQVCKRLLQNSQSADLSLLQLCLRIVFALFAGCKEHLKVQIEVFLTSIHMRVLESPSASNEQKELVLESIVDFCREPAMMHDLYVNYDCDVHCTNLFETLVLALCRRVPPPDGAAFSVLHSLALQGVLAVLQGVARRCVSGQDGDGNGTEDRISVTQAVVTETSEPRKPPTGGARVPGPHLDRLDERSSVTLPRTASGEDQRGAAPRTRSFTMPAHALVIGAPLRTWSPRDGSRSVRSSGRAASVGGSRGAGTEEEAAMEAARREAAEAVRERKRRKRKVESLAKKFGVKPKNWVNEAISAGLLPANPSAEDAAKMLREMVPQGIDKEAFGDWLSSDPDRDPFSAEVRDAFAASFDFRGLRITDALRLFLDTFKLPGEAQKIDRLMESMAQRFFADNPGPFANSDAAFVLAFSIIMLNTDLHSSQIANKMTVEQFIRNNRGINDGKNLPDEFLTEVYEDIKESEIRLVTASDPPGSDEGGLRAPDHSMADRWESVLRRSTSVADPAFTPAALSRSSLFRAGVHERDMVLLVADAVLGAMATAVERAAGPVTLERALEGMANYAIICAFFGLKGLLNQLVVRAANLALAEVDDVVARATTRSSAHRADMTDSLPRSLSSPTAPAPGAAMYAITSGSVPVEAALQVEAAAAIDPSASPSLMPGTGQDASSGLEMAALRDSDSAVTMPLPAFRAVRSVALAFALARRHSDLMREAWRNVVALLLSLRRNGLVDATLEAHDDFCAIAGPEAFIAPVSVAPPVLIQSVWGRGTLRSNQDRGPSVMCSGHLAKRIAEDASPGMPHTSQFGRPADLRSHVGHGRRVTQVWARRARGLDRVSSGDEGRPGQDTGNGLFSSISSLLFTPVPQNDDGDDDDGKGSTQVSRPARAPASRALLLSPPAAIEALCDAIQPWTVLADAASRAEAATSPLAVGIVGVDTDEASAADTDTGTDAATRQLRAASFRMLVQAVALSNRRKAGSERPDVNRDTGSDLEALVEARRDMEADAMPSFAPRPHSGRAALALETDRVVALETLVTLFCLAPSHAHGLWALWHAQCEPLLGPHAGPAPTYVAERAVVGTARVAVCVRAAGRPLPAQALDTLRVLADGGRPAGGASRPASGDSLWGPVLLRAACAAEAVLTAATAARARAGDRASADTPTLAAADEEAAAAVAALGTLAWHAMSRGVALRGLVARASRGGGLSLRAAPSFLRACAAVARADGRRGAEDGGAGGGGDADGGSRGATSVVATAVAGLSERLQRVSALAQREQRVRARGEARASALAEAFAEADAVWLTAVRAVVGLPVSADALLRLSPSPPPALRRRAAELAAAGSQVAEAVAWARRDAGCGVPSAAAHPAASELTALETLLLSGGATSAAGVATADEGGTASAAAAAAAAATAEQLAFPSAGALRAAVESVLLPLAAATTAPTPARALASLLPRVILQRVDTLRALPDMHVLWLKVAGQLARDMARGGPVAEAAGEGAKNAILVLAVSGEMARAEQASGQDVLALTWAVVDPIRPDVRADVEEAIKAAAAGAMPHKLPGSALVETGTGAEAAAEAATGSGERGGPSAVPALSADPHAGSPGAFHAFSAADPAPSAWALAASTAASSGSLGTEKPRDAVTAQVAGRREQTAAVTATATVASVAVHSAPVQAYTATTRAEPYPPAKPVPVRSTQGVRGRLALDSDSGSESGSEGGLPAPFGAGVGVEANPTSRE